MDQQIELLTKLLSFYRGRYEGSTLEAKFNEACDDLLSTGDLKRAVYIKFCIDNDIEPKIKKPVAPTRPSSSSGYSNDGCGSSRSYSRSSC